MRQTSVLMLLLFSFTPLALATGHGLIDIETRKSYRQECLEVAKYAVGDMMDVKCYYNYHHYNANAYRSYYNRDAAIKGEKIKIAEFNILHAGMSKTRYKDYKKVAQMINRWDVVGVTELLPLISDDLRHNQALVKFITKDAPEKIEKLKGQLVSQRSDTKIKQIKDQIESLEQDLKRAPSLYRDPGYLKVLKELRKLDNGKEWALLLSPRGEGAKKTDVQELTGYFYRSSKVKPKVNQYCKEIRTKGKGTPVACIPNMGPLMLGQSKKDIFSRRPFMAEFMAGKFSFTLLISHVVYNSPRDKKEMANILRKSFKINDYSELGTGATIENYARFAEVKVILEFMQALRERFSQKDIILLGDLNLDSENPFWQEVLPTMPGVNIFNKEKTSLSEARYNKDGSETNGLANDFDHFLFDPQSTDECTNQYGQVETKVESFFEGITGRYLKKLYKVRHEKKYRGQYTKNAKKYNSLVKRFITPYQKREKTFDTIGTKIIRSQGKDIRIKGIITDEKKVAKYIGGFYDRVLDSQFYDKTYYTYFKQLISDHMPISMECATN